MVAFVPTSAPNPITTGVDLQRGCDDGSILRLPGMGGAENLPSRAPPYIVFYDQCARIEVCLGTNPYMTADAESTIESPLDHDLRADEYAVAKLHRLGMLKRQRWDQPADYCRRICKGRASEFGA